MAAPGACSRHSHQTVSRRAELHAVACAVDNISVDARCSLKVLTDKIVSEYETCPHPPTTPAEAATELRLVELADDAEGLEAVRLLAGPGLRNDTGDTNANHSSTLSCGRVTLTRSSSVYPSTSFSTTNAAYCPRLTPRSH